jgi:hypothetical protein
VCLRSPDGGGGGSSRQWATSKETGAHHAAGVSSQQQGLLEILACKASRVQIEKIGFQQREGFGRRRPAAFSDGRQTSCKIKSIELGRRHQRGTSRRPLPDGGHGAPQKLSACERLDAGATLFGHSIWRRRLVCECWPLFSNLGKEPAGPLLRMPKANCSAAAAAATSDADLQTIRVGAS